MAGGKVLRSLRGRGRLEESKEGCERSACSEVVRMSNGWRVGLI